MTIRDERRVIGGAPVRLVYRAPAQAAGARGCVLFYHGLGASIAGQDNELYSLAQHGFLAVGIDNVGHGERRYPDFDARFSRQPDKVFCHAVEETAAEVPRIIDELLAQGLCRPDGIGVGGISMGGYIAYGSVLNDRRIRVLTPILGAPLWEALPDRSPHQYPERYFPVALLAQNAELDVSVPPRLAREFHERLQPYYRSAPETLAYVEFAGCGHFMPQDAWHELWRNVIAWYERFLPHGAPG